MTALREKTGWIFDLDGTLTRAIHDFDHIRSELGISAGQDILHALSVMPLERQKTALARLDELEHHYAAQTQPAPGVTECLELLHQRGCQLGILTRNRRDLAILSLEAIGLDRFFSEEVILGRDEATPKPSPEGIHQLLDKWHTPPQHAVMVGDFHYDLLCGRAAGVFTVHVCTEQRAWPEATDLKVASLAELTQLLLR
ncbi:HAD-IA family hydrolase [Neptuniibacter sp. CAU 1671]|uniref:HAD family hydrolase n=1 Tax=Neptuniibacter sp. CAU 1671 TaxID=3032593 RepID=UPI0023DB3993|nr:HAD-IA family hydrolase [Neptuniibacter sp. CAU 1671]MDF2182749.1 HAD-IA family hydrolase [Neptuniibacter sp. CAU 1671]